MKPPYAITCCWKCRRTDVTLFKVGDFDYVCNRDRAFGKPEIENQSKIYVKEEKK